MTVFIYPNFEKTHSLNCTQEAVGILGSLGCKIVMPEFCRGRFSGGNAEYSEIEKGVSECDVMISVGGDGTILKCAEYASKHSKELLGINCGRLGFMATLERGELDRLKSLIDGSYSVDERMMLEARIAYSGGGEKRLTALNEAVISSGYGSGIHDFTVLAGGVTVSSLRADGLIFSTPTGASGYSLSAGGPLIQPTLDCIEFTQICPHSLFARTMLFSPDEKIEIRFKADRDRKVVISADGRPPVQLSESDRLFITRSELRLKLIDLQGGSYFRAISSKLMQPAKPVDHA